MVFEWKPLSDDLQKSEHIARLRRQCRDGLAGIENRSATASHHAVDAEASGGFGSGPHLGDRGFARYRPFHPVQPGRSKRLPYGFRSSHIAAGDQQRRLAQRGGERPGLSDLPGTEDDALRWGKFEGAGRRRH